MCHACVSTFASFAVRIWCGLSCRRWRCSSRYCHIDEPICAGRNLFCYGLRAPLEALLAGVRAVLSGLSAALRLAAGVLRGVQFALKNANIVFDLAGNALNSGKKLLKEAINVFEAVVNFGLSNLLTINHVSVKASLATASKARFDANVDMTVLGASIKWKDEIYLPNPANLISDIMKRIRGVLPIGKKKRAATKVNKVVRLANFTLTLYCLKTIGTLHVYVDLQTTESLLYYFISHLGWPSGVGRGEHHSRLTSDSSAACYVFTRYKHQSNYY